MDNLPQTSKKLDDFSNKLQNIDLEKISHNQKIQRWIDELGNFSSPDRVYVYFFDEDDNNYVIASNTHEWCRKKTPSVKDEQQNIPIDLFPYYKQVLYERREIARINSVNDLPADAQSMIELMNFQGLKSILAIPIIKDSIPIGFIGFETVKKEAVWKNEDLKALEKVAGLIAINHR